MKKISILSVCALMGVTAFGQDNVVKEAKAAMEKGTDYVGVVKIITPAFSDPTTANSAQTYFIPGKAGFNTFDEMFKLATLGQLPADGEKKRSEALLGGYNYLMKALPLDSLPDKKGKVKPKYSKEIINLIGGHHADFRNIGIDFWNAENWEGAYEAWDIYCNLPSDPRFKKVIPAIPVDTILTVMFNRSLAAYQTGDMKKTLDSFLQAKAKGYTKKPLYDYAISAAYQLGDNDAVVALCQEAIPLYGQEDTRYIRQLISGYIEAKDYDGAYALINQAIEGEPDNAQYYVIRGILTEQQDKDPEADFQKAVDIDGYNVEALYNLGRAIYNKAVMMNNEAPTDPQEYAKVKITQINPVLKQAAEYLEQAYNIDTENKDPLRLLEQVYYLLDDATNLQQTQDRLAQ